MRINPNHIILVGKLTPDEMKELARLIAIDLSFEQCQSLIRQGRELAGQIHDAAVEKADREYDLKYPK